MAKNQSKNTDQKPDALVAEGLDPFNGEVYLFKDSDGFWIENWRTNQFSDYLTDENGKLIKNEQQPRACFERERTNTQFSQAIYQ